jgi:hypothetical protein
LFIADRFSAVGESIPAPNAIGGVGRRCCIVG